VSTLRGLYHFEGEVFDIKRQNYDVLKIVMKKFNVYTKNKEECEVLLTDVINEKREN